MDWRFGAAVLALVAAGCTAQGTGSSSSSGGEGSTSSSSTSSTSSSTGGTSHGTSSASTGPSSGTTTSSASATSAAGSSAGGTSTSLASSGLQSSSGVVDQGAKAITSFQLERVDGVINGTAITVDLPLGTVPTNLSPTILITGASVSPASGVAQDFSAPVTYTVSARDGSMQAYVVTVHVPAVTAAAGGTAVLGHGPGAGATVVIPAGALAADTTITVENGVNLDIMDGTLLGPAITFGPSGTQFSVPVQVTIPFNGAVVPPEQNLAVLKRNDDTQEITSLNVVGQTSNTVTAETSSFSTFQVVAVTNPVIGSFQADQTVLPAQGGPVTLTWTSTSTQRQALGLAPSAGITVPTLTGSSTTAIIRLPGNPLTSPVRYTITLTAVGAVGSRAATRSVNIVVGAATHDVFTKVVSGQRHWVALRNDGVVVTWGNNGNGEATPPPDLADVVDIAAHGSNSLALKADGTVVMWGDSALGAYVVPPDLTGVQAIALGEQHALAVKTDGTVVSWFADNARGQATVPADLVGVVAVAAGATHSLALKADGTVVAWGQDSLGYDPLTGMSDVGKGSVSGPRSLTNVTAIAAGRIGSLVLTADGQAHYFGTNGNGAYPSPSAVRLQDAVGVAASLFTRCVLKSDGSVVAWTNWVQPSFAAPSGPLGFTQIAAGEDYCVGLRRDGTLHAIHKPEMGLPFEALNLHDAKQVSVSQQPDGTANLGESHTLVLRQDGTVVSWSNVGTRACGTTGMPAGLSNVTQVSAGGTHSLALKADGTVVGWGCGPSAQVPADLSGVTAVAAGGDFSMALKSDGTIRTWGNRSITDGWDPEQGDYPPPTGAVCIGCTTPPLTNVKAIAAGSVHGLALLQDGTVVNWGLSQVGLLAAPAGLSNVKAISASGINAAALKEDGTIAVWGATIGPGAMPESITNAVAVVAGSSSNVPNSMAPLGGYRWFALLEDGTVTGAGATRFYQVAGASSLRNVVQLASGESTSAAVLSDGTVRGWGFSVVAYQARPAPAPVDMDGDGYPLPLDCNDQDVSISPAASSDTVGNGVDENCDGMDGTDQDGDGHASVATGGDDCEDTLPSVFPGAREVCGDGTANTCMGADVACVGSGWAAATPMFRERKGHASILLDNGKVLLVGDASVTSANQPGLAELFDPATGTFDFTLALTKVRQDHAMVKLQDGRVMVVGGRLPNASAVNTAEVFNPADGTWAPGGSLNCQASPASCANPGSALVGRFGHTATLLTSGTVLVVGGFNGNAFASSELWDPASATWSAGPSLSQARTGHTATRLPDGRVLVAGGGDGTNLVRYANVDLYSPMTNSFTPAANMPVAVQDAAAVLLGDGRVAVFGGTQLSSSTGVSTPSAKVQVFDPASGMWTLSQPLPYPAADARATLLLNGSVMVTAGTGLVSVWSTSVVPSGAFAEHPSMLTERTFHSAVRLGNGSVMVSGGAHPDSGNVYNTVETFSVP